MAEYIDREKLIKRLHNAEENYKADHDYDIDDDPFSDGILSAMFSVNQIVGAEPTADVIERSEYVKLQKENEILSKRVSFWKSQCKSDKELKELPSKIDKAIEVFRKEIEENHLNVIDYADGEWLDKDFIYGAIDRLKRNIGE